jgi:hypothetical protein
MTPRINEAWFSEALLDQLKQKTSGHQMDGLGVISELTHPAIIKTQHNFIHAMDQLQLKLSAGSYNLLTFKNQADALKNYPQTKSYGGFPWQVWQFLKDAPAEAVVHFGEMGSVYLSKSESFAPYLVPEVHHYTLPLWLDYALSPELWGPAGKWTRFHERLHTLFADNGLLIDQDFPGYYPLKTEAQWLGKHGFHGLQSNEKFILILTWDFPLSGLVELEKVLARGP